MICFNVFVGFVDITLNVFPWSGPIWYEGYIK